MFSNDMRRALLRVLTQCLRYMWIWIALYFAISEYDDRETSRETGSYGQLLRIARSVASYVSGEGGTLPQNLDQLKQTVGRDKSLSLLEPIPESELFDAWGEHFQMRVIDKTKIEIYSLGRNKKAGSPRDLVFSDDIRITVDSTGKVAPVPEPPFTYISWPIRVRFLPRQALQRGDGQGDR